MIEAVRGFGLRRGLTHVVLAALSALGLYATTLYAPRGEAGYIFMIGFGYVSLILLAVTLLIGPVGLLRKRFNPVNIDLRRDTGIWAGITGVLHVVFALVEHNRGGILALFFRANGLPLLTLTGINNYLGAVATGLLILLLVLSNTLALRRLKGKRWKRLQRLNYWLTGLAFAHALLYQMSTGRQQIFTDATAIGLVVVLVVQLVGVAVYQRRKAAHQPPPTQERG